jgi:nucleoside 2-deoxyribosyltransferase
MLKIYAAGSIAGKTQESASGWRNRLIDELSPYGVKVLSPMRATEHLANRGELTQFAYDGDIMTTEKAITTRDRNDVMTCDLMFVNLHKVTRYSLGTMIELGWADAWRKPIVAIMEEGNIHEHAMTNDMINFKIKHADFEDAMKEAIYVTKSILDIRPVVRNRPQFEKPKFWIAQESK